MGAYDGEEGVGVGMQPDMDEVGPIFGHNRTNLKGVIPFLCTYMLCIVNAPAIYICIPMSYLAAFRTF